MAESSPSKPGGTGGLRSRIAAFESGAASNASWANVNSKDITPANLTNLRSKFDKEDEKPVSVKGSFGLGAPPPQHADDPNSLGVHGKGGQRAVSLGGGRAVSPMGSPSIVVPSPTAKTHSPTASSHRPTSLRSVSSSTSTTASSSNATTVSSLLPTLGAAASRQNTLDDASGLKTPMSSISLSSMAVETGSTAGDTATSVGDIPEEKLDDDEISRPGTPLDQVPTPSAEEPASTAQLGGTSTEAENIPGSAAELEKAEKVGILSPPSEGEEHQVTQDDLQKAKEDLENYEKEEPAASAQEVPRLDVQEVLDDGTPADDASPEDETALAGTTSQKPEIDAQPVSPSKITSPQLKRSPSSRSNSSRPSSLISPRLRRSFTANSLADSQPESDVADTNLDNYAYDSDRLGVSSVPPASLPAQEKEAGPEDPAGITEVEKAKEVGESIAPKPADGNSDAPVSGPDVIAESVNKMSLGDKAQSGDESMELDESGMPKVKCSDCGVKVSLLDLGEHVCAPMSPSKSQDASHVVSPSGIVIPPTPTRPTDVPRDEDDEDDDILNSYHDERQDSRELGRRDLPDDVPTSDFSPSPAPSPAPAHRGLPTEPDVPRDMDDRESVASHTDTQHDELSSPQAGPSHVAQATPMQSSGTVGGSAQDTEEEEDYMTAYTSRRDSMDTQGNGRPIAETPSSSMRNLAGVMVAEELEDDDETEELASFAVDQGMNTSNDTPRINHTYTTSAAPVSGDMYARQPDSPTPDALPQFPDSPTKTLTPTTAKPLLGPGSPMAFDGANATQHGIGMRRRSVGRSPTRNLADTDSEGEHEPGTVTIIRQ